MTDTEARRAGFEAHAKSEWPSLPLHRRDALPVNDPRYGEYVHLNNEWITWQAALDSVVEEHAATVKDSLTVGSGQHARDSAELRRLCAERDALRAELAAIRASEPLGWITDDYDTDKSATTYAKAMAEHWRAKGWDVRPIFSAPQPQLDVQALVEALEAYVDACKKQDILLGAITGDAEAALAAYRKAE